MVLPIIKFGIVCFKYTVRPVNGMIKKSLKSRQNPPHYGFLQLKMIGFGQIMHRFEQRLNKAIVDIDSPGFLMKTKIEIKPLR